MTPCRIDAPVQWLLLVVLLLMSQGALCYNASIVCEDRLSVVCNSSCFCQGQRPTQGENVSSWGAKAGNTTGEIHEANVALAFGLVSAASLSTALGASLVFCDTAVTQEQFIVLGAALGFSGGVMIYVSFVEIFIKSRDAFAACNQLEVNPCLWEDEDDSSAYVMATICLFAGVIFTFMIDMLVVCISRRGGSHGHSHNHQNFDDHAFPREKGMDLIPQSILHSESGDLFAEGTNVVTAAGFTAEKPATKEKGKDTDTVAAEEELKKNKLEHMGIMTALAIGLHNFPEGLATFVATLSDPAVGVALAVAIAIHNIPEGLCVAIPLYYSTGSRWRGDLVELIIHGAETIFVGFCFALLSGVTEIIGAALGYLLLMTVLGDVAYGVLFGVVSGMMITIVVKELLPTAHRYDVHDKYITISFFVGASVMGLSLILFVV